MNSPTQNPTQQIRTRHMSSGPLPLLPHADTSALPSLLLFVACAKPVLPYRVLPSTFAASSDTGKAIGGHGRLALNVTRLW